MAAVAVIPNQNVVQRVTSLPLVSSTYGMMSDAYTSTKGTHPYIKCVCEAAEHGVQTITFVALTSAQPIINTLEPQIAIANVLACYGLDKIEKTLPILQKQSDQIVADAVHAVSGAKDAVTVKVTGAKDTVSGTLNHMVVRTQGAVTGAKDTVSGTLNHMVVRTQGAVTGGVEITISMVNTVLDSRVAHMVSSGVDTALSKSEGLVEQYLPLTEEELALEVKTVRGFDRKEPSYYVRLGSLSTKLRKRAYTRALAKVLDAKQRSQESIAQLNNTVDLIEYAKKNMNGAYSLVDWTSGGVKQEKASNGTEVIESRTLVLAHSLTQQLQTTCLVLVSGLQGLPHHIQQEALSISSSAAQVYASFRKAMAFGDLPDSMLANSKVQLVKMKESLDNVMDYLINNTPLNWLVGPFYPRMDLPAAAANTPPAMSSPSSSNSQYPMEVEMDSLASLDSLAAAANTPPATSSPSSSNSQLEEEGNAPVSPCRPAVSSSSNGQIPMEVEMDMQQSSC